MRSGLGHFVRLVRYIAVGGIATAVLYLLLILLVRGFGMAPTPASSIGFALSAVVNYLLNYRFTFQSDRPHGPAVAKFVVLAGVGFLINAAMMHWLVTAGVRYLIAQLCATAVVLLFGFIGNSVWTFGAAPVGERTGS
jgi:putative flippase GtrA